MVEAHRYHVRKYGISLSLTIFSRGEPRPGIEFQIEVPHFTLGGYLYG